MSNPYIPTLLYPNGGEIFLSGVVIPIAWSVPNPDTSDGRSVVVEVYYNDNYNPQKEPDWQQIAVLPDNSITYNWQTPPFIHSPRCRIAVRTRNTRGERSGFCVSADNFLITHRKLVTPAVISPVNGSRYDRYIEIVPDDRAIDGFYSQRSLYQFFYSSVSVGIPITPIAQNIPIGTKSIIWNTIDIPSSDDYVIQVVIQDDDNNSSDALFIQNITISHEGFFLIDTTPPVSSIVVNNGNEFTQFQEITVSIVSYDETTGVQSMQIIEGSNKALPEQVANVRPFTLSTGDGTKAIELLLQDFGANRNNNSIQHLFGTVLQQSGLEIVDIAFDAMSTAWLITKGTSYNLYSISEYPQIVYTFTDIPTAVGVFNALVYIGTKNASNTGILYRYSGALTVNVIYAFTDPDSVINCIITHNNIMYMGFENGNIYSYDGAVLVKIATVVNPVSSLMSDGNSLYLAMENDDNVYIYNGSNFVQTGA